MKEYEDIAIEVKDYIAKITIQRPPNNFFESFPFLLDIKILYSIRYCIY